MTTQPACLLDNGDRLRRGARGRHEKPLLTCPQRGGRAIRQVCCHHGDGDLAGPILLEGVCVRVGEGDAQRGGGLVLTHSHTAEESEAALA